MSFTSGRDDATRKASERPEELLSCHIHVSYAEGRSIKLKHMRRGAILGGIHR